MLAYPVAMIVVGAAATYVLALAAATLIATAGFPLPPGNKRIGCIDGMRGFLALSVLIHHFIIWMQVVRLGGGWEAPTVNAFNQIGAGCVALFFMTTGFVFYPRILVGFRTCSWPAIYTTRLFRIVPLIAVSVAIITVLIAVRTGRLPGRDYPAAAASWISAWDEPPLLGYPDSGRLNAYVLWSLWYEWLFYLFVLPVCALAMDLVRRRLPTWTVPLVLGFGAIVARFAGAPGMILIYLPVFAIGMLAYELQQYERIARALRAPWASVVSALCIASGMTCAPTPYTGVLPLFGVVFICIACGNSMGGLLRTKGALVLGECSYAIYLLHGIVLSLLFVDGARFTARIATDKLPILLPLAGAAVVLIASLVYRGVERPSIAAGIRLARVWTDRGLRRDSAELEVAP